MDGSGRGLARAARVVPMMLAALSAWHADHAQIVVAGPHDRADTLALLGEATRRYRPFATVIPVDPDAKTGESGAERALPWIAAMRMRDGHATAYVCRAFACREPVTDAEALAAQL